VEAGDSALLKRKLARQRAQEEAQQKLDDARIDALQTSIKGEMDQLKRQEAADIKQTEEEVKQVASEAAGGAAAAAAAAVAAAAATTIAACPPVPVYHGEGAGGARDLGLEARCGHTQAAEGPAGAGKGMGGEAAYNAAAHARQYPCPDPAARHCGAHALHPRPAGQAEAGQRREGDDEDAGVARVALSIPSTHGAHAAAGAIAGR
jgi:hypothetical protein